MLPTKHSKTLLITIMALIAVVTLNATTTNAYIPSTKPYELLIIGPQSYENTIERFIEFKLSQQIPALYVSTENLNLSGAKEPTRLLHDYVANEISQASIRSVLFVGNYDQVPTRYVYSPSDEDGLADFNYKPTDWYYTVPNWEDSKIGYLGANVPQIAVGRLPVNNQQELQQTLAKIMDAENTPSSPSLATLNEPSLNLNPNLNFPYNTCTLSINQTTTQIDKLISGNVTYLASYTHGTPSALWTKTDAEGWQPLFTQTQAAELKQNFNIFYLVACFTGALDLKDESLSRTLITSPNGPALVIASSRTEGSDNSIASSFWTKLFASGNVGESFTQALGGYINDPAVFSPDNPTFQRYNFYLDKVIYGDPSWHIQSTQLSQAASAQSPPAQANLVLLGNQENKNATANFGGTIIGASIVCSLVASAIIVTRFYLSKGRQLTQLRIQVNDANKANRN
jgi:hypothetical protein